MGVPAGDRNNRILLYRLSFFTSPGSHHLSGQDTRLLVRNMPVVIIKMAKGRTIEQKKVLIREFTKTITDTLAVEPEMVTIFIDELDRDNIGKSGRMLSDSAQT